MAEPMWAGSEVWRLASAALLSLLAAVLLRDHRRDRSALASVALMATVTAHLVLPLLLRARAALLLTFPVLLLAMAVPFAFWVLAQVHFEDDFQIRGAHVLLLLGLLSVGSLSWFATVERTLDVGPFAPAYRVFWMTLPRILSLVLVIHALLRIHVGAASDLLVARLRARHLVLGVAGSYIVVELLGGALVIGSGGEALAERVHSLVLLLLVWAVAYLSLRTAPDMLRPPRITTDSPALDPALGADLQRLLEVEQVFREEGLTIGSLAERLGTQEYRLRQLINAQLGFKNFNTFLHSFRIRAATTLLADPEKGHLGVAEIAYQVGYRSLATFNKSFKDVTGQTPTQYRGSRAG